jgi:hypothetical protein
MHRQRQPKPKGGRLNIKKPLLVLGAVTSIGLAGMTGLGVASAASGSSSGDTIIDKIASKFNLNKDDVRAVFDEERSEREAEHQQKVEERLSKAVKEGKLTESQKVKIIAKLAELKAEREADRDAMKGKTTEECRAIMQQKREELRQWAKGNGISLTYLHFGFGGPHGHGGHGMDDSTDN